MNWIDEIKEEEEEEQTNHDGNKNMNKIQLKTEVILSTKPIVGEIVDYAERENIEYLYVIGF